MVRVQRRRHGGNSRIFTPPTRGGNCINTQGAVSYFFAVEGGNTPINRKNADKNAAFLAFWPVFAKQHRQSGNYRRCWLLVVWAYQQKQLFFWKRARKREKRKKVFFSPFGKGHPKKLTATGSR